MRDAFKHECIPSSVTEGSCLLHWGQPDTGQDGSECSVTCHTKCTCLPGQRVTGQQETAGLGKHFRGMVNWELFFAYLSSPTFG